MSKVRPTLSRRRVLQLGAAAAAVAATYPVKAPAQVSGAKPFAGTTINVACWSSPYAKLLADYVPEFEQKTGMKVSYETPAFPVYNQRADLELSTKGSAYDVLNITFIYSSRWIGAGWFTPLDEFIKDPNKTPAEWEPKDFLEGLVKPHRDKNNRVYGFPWIADSMICASARFDLVKQAGFGMPRTFDEMMTILKAVHRKDGVAGFVNENHHGWTFPPYIQGFGGKIFRDPPDDLMPTLDSPEAVQAAEYYANILKNYAPSGVLSFMYDQAANVLKLGRANLITFNHAWLLALGDPKTSQVAKTVNYGMMPAGPKGAFPGVASHAWGIPTGSKKKDAAWEFIKWSLSKELLHRLLVEKGYGSITRASVIKSAEFKKQNLVNDVDVSELYLKTIDLAATGYMAYRTVHVFPQVDKQLDKAIELVASGQMSGKEAMKSAQENSINDLKKAGVKL
jgi:multiple sugar transport system substrate-binding protein